MKKNIIKAIIIIASMLLTMGCSSKKEEEIRQRPDGTPMTEYQVYENEVKDGIFYVRHKDSICEPVYLGEATFDKGSVSSHKDNNRVVWFREDYQKIPTMYKGESLIYYTQNVLNEKFTYERYEDYGYSIGIRGLDDTDSGRYQISTNVEKKCTYPGSDADAILQLDNTTVIIDSIGDVQIRVPEENSSNEEAVTRFGSIGHLTKDKKYNVKVFEGTVEHNYVLTADVRMMASMEGEVTADYSFSGDNKITLTIPPTFNSGYYLINGIGLFRYIDGTSFDEESTDMNKPNTEKISEQQKEQSNGLVKEVKTVEDDSVNNTKEENELNSTEDRNTNNDVYENDEASFDPFAEEGLATGGETINSDISSTSDYDPSEFSKVISKFNITSAGPLSVFITFDNENGKVIEDAATKIQAVISDPEGNAYSLFIEDEKTLTIEFESTDVGMYVIHYIGLENAVPKVQVTTK